MRTRTTKVLDRALAFDHDLVLWRKNERSEAPGVFLETGRTQKIDAVTNAAHMERHRMWAP